MRHIRRGVIRVNKTDSITVEKAPFNHLIKIADKFGPITSIIESYTFYKRKKRRNEKVQTSDSPKA